MSIARTVQLQTPPASTFLPSEPSERALPRRAASLPNRTLHIGVFLFVLWTWITVLIELGTYLVQG